MILLDTSGVLSAIDGSEPRHRASAQALSGAGEPRLLSPFVLAELDYLLTTRVSANAARRFLDEVGRGAYELATFDTDDVSRAGQIMDRYQDLVLGLADASIIVLADRYGTRDVMTLDKRHFRAFTATDGQPLRLLPADA